MRSALAGVALAATLSAAASPARAQRVRGALTDSVTHEAIAGAVVILFDSAGRGLSRSIADTRGQYSVSRFPTTRTMRVMRIGFRPRELAIGVADSVVDLRLQQVAALLRGVAASDDRVCAGNATSGGALDLWEQARAGLLASVVSREATPPRIRLRGYRRVLDVVTRNAVADTVEYKEIVDGRSFVAARPPWVFAEYGYMRELGGGSREYYAPDESVLLDPTFADTHCFHVIEGRGPRAGQIGMAFDPVDVPGRDTIVDIVGALWLDRATFVPRTIEFHYTSLEREARDAGGDVDFAVMPNGVSMIERWQIRSPILAFDVPANPPGLVRRDVPRPDRRNVRVLAYQQLGGQVAAAMWRDGKRWVSDLPRIQGTVLDMQNAPVPRAVVWLSDTRDTVRADSAGRFEFVPMVAGSYTVMASDSVLAPEGVARALPTTAMLFSNANAEMRLRFYPRSDVLASICPAQSYRPGTGVLLAHVIDSLGAPVPSARIEVETASLDDTDASRPPGQLRVGITSEDGHFVVCGAERDRRLIIRAYKGDRAAGMAVNRWGDEVLLLSLTIRPVKP